MSSTGHRASGPVTIRQLTAADLPGIVSVHIAAFPDAAMTKLGAETVRRYYEWQLLGPHKSVGLGAFDGDKMVGLLVGGTFRGSLAGFVKKNRAYLTLRVLTRPWLLANPFFRDRFTVGIRALFNRLRTKPTKYEPPYSRENSFGIISLGVHPEHRGMSALLLLKEAERIATERGFRQLHHCVHPHNTPVVKMYDLLGHERILEDGVWRGTLRKLLPAGR